MHVVTSHTCTFAYWFFVRSCWEGQVLLCRGYGAAVAQPRHASDRDFPVSAAVHLPRWPNRGSWATAIFLLAAVMLPRWWNRGSRATVIFWPLPRYICRGSSTAAVETAAVSQREAERFFAKTTSLHLDLIYICLVCLGSSTTPKITLLRASWASSSPRYQDFTFKLQNHKNPSSCIFHSSSSMILGWFHLGFLVLLTWLVSRTSFSYLYVLALQDSFFITWIDSRLHLYDLT